MSNWVNSLWEFVLDKLPYARPILSSIPVIFRPPILAMIAIIAIAAVGLSFFHDKIGELVGNIYGPDVIIGIISPEKIKEYGNKEYGHRSLLYEFKFKKGLATSLRDDKDVEQLFKNGRPVDLKVIPCSSLTNFAGARLYKLILVAENRGDRTAKDYKMTVVFSSDNINAPDPQVRIIDVGSDALDVGYLYKQDENLAAPGCAGLPTVSNEPTTVPQGGEARTATNQENRLVSSSAEHTGEKQGPPKIPEMTRQTYKELKLTRDMVIFQGTLEANLFQIATVLVAVPTPTKPFAVLFNIECSNCSWFYRTMTFGQLVNPQ